MTPFRLQPVYKDYLWGGTKLLTDYHKATALRPVAESWEVSCHPDGASMISSGIQAGKTLQEVLQRYPEYIGINQTAFPLLIKFIDAKESLSLQVHPNDEYAMLHEGELGKNEMWYVVEAEPNAELIVGFQQPFTPKEIRKHIEDNTILEVVNRIPVRVGDCFAIPAGMIHGIGAGTVVAEVQQNSNTTYRVYDYNRTDKNGISRELHIEKAIQVIDSSLQTQNRRATNIQQAIFPLIDWKYFSTNLLTLSNTHSFSINETSFQALIVAQTVEGILYKDNQNEFLLQQGETLFLPACNNQYCLIGKGTALQVSL